jgi:hypothetical protein
VFTVFDRCIVRGISEASAELLGFGGVLKHIQLQTLIDEAWPDVKLPEADVLA